MTGPSCSLTGEALLFDLAARVAQQDEQLRRLDASVRALARLSDAEPAPPCLTDTKPTLTDATPTPPIIPWPTRPAVTEDADLLRVVADRTPDAIVGLDATGRVRIWNQAATRFFGWTAAEALGHPPPFLPDDKIAEHEELMRGVRRGETVRDMLTIRRGQDGGLLPVRVSVETSQSGGAVFVFRPIVEERDGCDSESLTDPTASRFITLGRALTGVAHDFNNLLAVIQGYAGLLVEQAATGSPSRDAADTIAAAAELAGEVSRHLLSVVRPEPGTAPRADVNLLLNRLGRVLKAIVGARVTLAITPATELELAAIHPAELTQVLLNLATNARDAMRDGGTLTIRTATQHAGPDRPGWPVDVPAGEFVVLTISDTGTGMDETTRLRAFEPFFTTKANGGHGIGLATIREIVARIGGHVEIESEPGWGTQVRVYLRCV
jgi:PAS domain S-box-containing protein